MSVIMMIVASTAVFAGGYAAAAYRGRVRRRAACRRRIVELQDLHAGLRDRAAAGRAAPGLVAWARQHASKLLSQGEDHLETAVKLVDRDLGIGEDMTARAGEVLAMAGAVLDCTARYFQPQTGLDHQKLLDLLEAIEGLRRSLARIAGRQVAAHDTRNEIEQLGRLEERIAASRNGLGGDEHSGLRGVRDLLHALDEITGRLDTKTGGQTRLR